MPAQRIMLEKGQDPLKMEFTEPRPNPLKGCLIGIALMIFSSLCCVGTLLVGGIIKWPG